MVDISTVGTVPVTNRSALETSRRELSEDVSFGIGTGTLLVVEQSRLETPADGCDMHGRMRVLLFLFWYQYRVLSFSSALKITCDMHFFCGVRILVLALGEKRLHMYWKHL